MNIGNINAQKKLVPLSAYKLWKFENADLYQEKNPTLKSSELNSILSREWKKKPKAEKEKSKKIAERINLYFGKYVHISNPPDFKFQNEEGMNKDVEERDGLIVQNVKEEIENIDEENNHQNPIDPIEEEEKEIVKQSQESDSRLDSYYQKAEDYYEEIYEEEIEKNRILDEEMRKNIDQEGKPLEPQKEEIQRLIELQI